MVSVNCFAFFSKDDPRRCHRSHVGLAFDLQSLYANLDCKNAFSLRWLLLMKANTRSDQLFSVCLCLLGHSPTLDFENDVSWPNTDFFRRVFGLCHDLSRASTGHTQNPKNMKDSSLCVWSGRLHRSAPFCSFQGNLVRVRKKRKPSPCLRWSFLSKNLVRRGLAGVPCGRPTSPATQPATGHTARQRPHSSPTATQLGKGIQLANLLEHSL
jgi:hypothetical protein